MIARASLSVSIRRRSIEVLSDACSQRAVHL